jgi:hypothetical protein
MHLPWKAQLLAKTGGNMEMFALHDFDGDGVPELYAACYRKERPREVWRWTKAADGRPRSSRSCWARRAAGTASPSATSTATGARTC